MKKIHKFLLLFLMPFWAIGQNTIGLPNVVNFHKPDYNAGTQNWDIKQDNNGIIYFANNEGLLSFDGKYWNLFPLPNKTIVRSIEIGKDDNIYVGGQDELGYFSPNANGHLTFHSLTNIIAAKDKNFGDVWDIVASKQGVFFRTGSKIFHYYNQQVSVFNAPTEWSFMGNSNMGLIAHDFKQGLLIFKDNQWAPFSFPLLLPVKDAVTSIFNTQSNLLIATLKNGIFKLTANGFEKINTPILNQISLERIYAASAIGKDRMALSTNIGGFYVLDLNGNLIQQFSKKEGIQNNNILSTLLDAQGNIWLGLDNGIDCIAYNSAIKHLTPNDQDASGYTSIIFNNKLYTGTSGGLYSTTLQQTADLSFSKGYFEYVNNTVGQTWGLSEINGKLLLSHHDGAFIIENNQASPISTTNGYWNFTPTSAVYPSEKIVSGNYKGVTFFNFKDNKFEEAEKVPDFEESSRYLAIDKHDNIWVSHPYHGVFKIAKDQNGKMLTRLYSEKNGLPNILNNHIFKVKNEVVVGTEKGIYVYNSENDRFEPSTLYTKIIGSQSIRYLKEDTDGNIWFIHEKTLGVIDMTNQKTEVIYLPELNNKMLSGFESIYPVNASNIFLGGEKGFYHINYDKYKKSKSSLQIRIRSVKINNQKDSTIFGGYFSKINDKPSQSKQSIPYIDYQWKNIHFEFAAPINGQENNLRFSYKLKGFDKEWSDWTEKTEKDYTNLPTGDYTFEVKAKNNLGVESPSIAYAFHILPPWYRSIWAYGFYLIVALIGMYYFYARQRKKFHVQQEKYEEEQKRLHYLHQLEINKAENELVSLRNDKLQGEIDFKNSELATNAMHLVQKGELLAKIKTELTNVLKAVDIEKALADIKKLIKVLSEDEKMDKDWEHFAQHFDKVHSDFVAILKDKHQNITPNELKLCTYLRMNLSTKEIAQLMNISVRGIEISRYRLRKKLGIATEISLFDYLINLSNKNQST